LYAYVNFIFIIKQDHSSRRDRS